MFVFVFFVFAVCPSVSPAGTFFVFVFVFFVFVVCPGFPVGVLAVIALCRSLMYVMFMIMWLNMLD